MQLDRPIFVLGCGRSGTTVLGTSIGSHRQIAYLHEPREIWFRAFPQSDIWSEHARERGGRIVLDHTDWTPAGADLLVDGFAAAVAAQGRQRLCEKLPINNFRLGLIDRIFPDGLFVYIERDPIAVARSIAEADRSGGWFAVDGYKWEQLIQLAEANPATNGVAARCTTSLHKGLLEWVLSTSFATTRLDALPAQRVMRITYAQFTSDPAGVFAAIEAFAGVGHDPEAAREVAANVRPAGPVAPVPDDPVIRALLAAAGVTPAPRATG